MILIKIFAEEYIYICSLGTWRKYYRIKWTFYLSKGPEKLSCPAADQVGWTWAAAVTAVDGVKFCMGRG